MTEDEADKAHEVSELFQELIITLGATLLKNLTPTQQEYIVYKACNEFRFWRIKDKLQ